MSASPRQPRDLAAAMERAPRLPRGPGERFRGYGVLGVTHASGHLLALRRYPASSIGPGYASVWHRPPGGGWTLYSDVEPRLGCARFFGADATARLVDEIALVWAGPRVLRVTVPEIGLAWALHLAPSPATHLLDGLSRLTPPGLRGHASTLRMIGGVGTRALGLGRFRLEGRTPSRNRFRLWPERVWMVDASAALLDGVNLGPAVLPAPAARLGDFWIPRRGIFAAGTVALLPCGPPDRRRT